MAPTKHAGEPDFIRFEQASESSDEADVAAKDRIEKRFDSFGPPLSDFDFAFGPPWQNMVMLQIPTEDLSSEEAILAEQEDLIRDYIMDMRERWARYIDAMGEMGEEFVGEWSAVHVPFATDAVEARWEAVRSFADRRLSQGPVPENAMFLPFLLWYHDRRNLALTGDRLAAMVNQWRVPFVVGQPYRVEIDWALPYVATYRGDMSEKLAPDGVGQFRVAYFCDTTSPEPTEGQMAAGPPAEFMPFHNFGPSFATVTRFVVGRNEQCCQLDATGYVPMAVYMHVIRQIEMLWWANREAVRTYQAYIQRLGIIRAVLRGKPVLSEDEGKAPRGLGPFAEWTEYEFRDEYKKANDPIYRRGWEKDTSVDVVDPEYLPGSHSWDLLLGIADIDRLIEFFESVVDTEFTDKSVKNAERIQCLRTLFKRLADFYLQSTHDDNHTDLWWRNQDSFFGVAFYDHMVMSVLSCSEEAERVYSLRVRPRIFENPKLEVPPEKYKEWAIGQGIRVLSDPANWFLMHDVTLTEVYRLYAERHLNSLKTFHASHLRTLDPQRRTRTFLGDIYKMLRRYRDGAAVDRLGTNIEKRLRALCQNVDDPVRTNPLVMAREARAIIEDEIKLFEDVGTTKRSVVFARRVGFVSSLALLYSFLLMDDFEGDSLADWANAGALALSAADVAGLYAKATVDAAKLDEVSRATKLLANRRLVQFFARGARFLGPASGAVGALMGAYGAFKAYQRGDVGVAVAQTVGAAAAAIYLTGGALLAFKIQAGALLCTGPVGWLILAIELGVACLLIWQPWKTRADIYCDDFLLHAQVAAGGMEAFELFKGEFHFESGGNTENLRYDTSRFGQPLEVISLVKRVESFITDGDTFDGYE